VGLFTRRPWVRPTDEGFALELPAGLRDALPHLGSEVEALLDSDEPLVRRVFPTAYPDDPDREAGYQALVRGELVDRHRAGLALIADTVEADHLTAEELTSWMTTVNAMRLVLGTALDVDEESEPEYPDDDPRAITHQFYVVLSILLGDIVDAFDARG
jgi:hypothetical protein